MNISEMPLRDVVLDSACPLDCPDSCSLAVTVRDGTVVRVDGSRRNSLTDGYICAKVRRFPERLYGNLRLRYPARRVGPKGEGAFARISWDEALDEIARRMAEACNLWGGESILPYSYGGSNGLLTQDTADARLFRRLGASRLARTVCAAPTGAAHLAMYGKMAGVAFEDYAHAALIVIWGANPSVTGLHLVPHVRAALKRGAKLVVVDPRATPLARQADLHLAVRPGTDLVVALALHRHLFEAGDADVCFLAPHTRGADRLRARAAEWTFDRTAGVAGVDPAALERFAHLYARLAPAVIRCGWGMERNRNGGSAAAAIMALPAVAGKFGVRGGGFTMSNSAAWVLDRAKVQGSPESSTRVVNMNRLGRVLAGKEGPAVRVLYVYNSNLLVTTPDQNAVRAGLLRDDLFTVVHDQVMTDTARFADIVLPATTFLEAIDLPRGYGSLTVQAAKPVVTPQGEARSNIEVFSALCDRLGLSRPGDCRTEDEILRGMLDGMPRESAARLESDGLASPPCGSRPIQFEDVFPHTADGRIDLFPETLDRAAPLGLYGFQPDPATARHPLALISPASDKTISSTLGEINRVPASLVMHPDDAVPRGLREGDAVRVFNELGEVRCRVKVSSAIRPGVVNLPKGLWSHATLNGATATALAPDTLTDFSGGACFNDARVEVEALAAS